MAGKRKTKGRSKTTSMSQFNVNRLLLIGVVLSTIFVGYLYVSSPTGQRQRQKSSDEASSVLSEVSAFEISKKVSWNQMKEEDLDVVLISRIVGSEGHTKVRKHIVSVLESLEWDVELDSFENNTPLGKKTFHNIIATLNPDASSRMILAAHYDSKVFEGQEFIGATDSAVPCAMLLHLARRFTHALKNHQQDTTLQLVFFDGEEAFVRWTETDSIYGARHLAKKWEKEPSASGDNKLSDIEVLVLLDLLGTPNPRFMSFFSNTNMLFKKLADIEEALKRKSAVQTRRQDLFMKTLPGRAPQIEDDHIPFLQRNVPILHIIPVPFPRVWHQISDNGDAIDPETTEDLLKIFAVFTCQYFQAAC